MSERERIEKVRNFFRFNKKTFSELLGYTRSQSYTNYLGGASNLSLKAVKLLLEYDDNINGHWILTGVGSMLLNSSTSDNSKIINGDRNNVQVGNNNEFRGNNHNNSDREANILTKKIELLEQRIKDKDVVITAKDELIKNKNKLIQLLEKQLEK